MNARKGPSPELRDRTRNLNQAFHSTENQNAESRERFLKLTRKLGALSPSGTWLVQNAADGEIASSPAQTMDDEDPPPEQICPICWCQTQEQNQSTLQRLDYIRIQHGGASSRVLESIRNAWDARPGPSI